MTYTIQNGQLIGTKQHPVAFIASPNFNARPNSPPPNSKNKDGDDSNRSKIRAIIIHNISLPPNPTGDERLFGQTDGNGQSFITALFLNQLDPAAHPYFAAIANLTVSAHLLIDRNGGATQYVNFADRAWHAGQSVYLGVKQCNDFTIGIELEGADGVAYTDAQYTALAAIVFALNHAYPKTRRHLAGHSDIARGRKTDPSASFDWQRFRAELSALHASNTS